MLHSIFIFIFTILTLSFFLIPSSFAGLLSQAVTGPDQPYMVPAFPTQTENQICSLDLSAELFGGVSHACGGRTLDRSRCCPVLAAWLFAAHARSALQLPAPSPAPAAPQDDDLPMMPDDSQKCVDSLQSALVNRSVHIPAPNATCDAVLCFCGIRLHQISSLSCPAAFNVSGSRNATPTAAVRSLEKSCGNSSYAGCTKCLGALHKLKGGYTNKTADTTERAKKMFNLDCQLMGLTWLLARNKTKYIPTVSAVMRAIMYSPHQPHDSRCSPDQENMPLAVDSLTLERAQATAPRSISVFPILPLIIAVALLS